MIDHSVGDKRFVAMGQIVTAHGIRGGVKVKSFTDNPMDLFTFSPFWVGQCQYTHWASYQSVGKGFFRAFLHGLTDRTAALGLRGQLIQVMRSQMRNDPDSVYYVDLQGRQVVDARGALLGCVGWVHDFGAGAVLEVKETGHMVALQEIEDVDAPVLKVVYAVS